MAKKTDLSPIRREIIVGKMERYGINNDEVAVKLRVSVSKWFTMKKNPAELSLQQAEILKELLRMDTEEFFRFTTGIDFDSAFKAKAGRLGLKVLAG